MLKKENRQAEMFALVEELPQSRMTQEEFCKLKGLSKNCFYYWQKKYRQHHSADSSCITSDWKTILTDRNV